MKSQFDVMSSFLMKYFFKKNHIIKDKKQNSIGICPKLTIICEFLLSIVFNTICGWYNFYYLNIASNLRFHNFYSTLSCARAEIDDVS